MSSLGDSGEVLQQVCSLWSMMDDLCQSDPEGYRTFIQQQVKAGAEHNSPPDVHCRLRTSTLEPEETALYINICSWKRVPARQDPSMPLPVCAGKLEKESDEDGCFILDVAFNPCVLQECERDQEKMKQLFMQVMGFFQQQHGMKLSPQHTVVNSCPRSSVGDLYRRLGFQKSPKRTDLLNTASQNLAPIMQQLSLHSQGGRGPAAQFSGGPAKPEKTDLIQVVSSTSAQPEKPSHRFEVKTDAAGAASKLEVTVELPKVSAALDCRLEISHEELLLQVEDVYYLLMDFPRAVNDKTAAAVFDKHTRKLILQVDLL
ncbi:PIH1 domain-containing protein 2 isoform X1 [Synchiropus splendidus]|uniref:PIH1 domain-containing protein 2 isoform X1 n=1 Tax=Synchiropus splendidus TaxID=270530 RepID=UPI00237DCA35|nr:PIH1 domain-containing protein 2 isoform X1 [Synchiropus splendidus]